MTADVEPIVTDDPVVAFLYLLLAEELPYNRVARLVDRVSWLGKPTADRGFTLDGPLGLAAVIARGELLPAERSEAERLDEALATGEV